MSSSTDLDAVRELTVAELFARAPETVTVFMRHRMACIGCDLGAFETVDDAIAHYALDEEPFLAELAAVRAATPRTDRRADAAENEREERQ